MNPKYNNDRCPVCDKQFKDLYGEYRFYCPECYTELKVKYYEIQGFGWFYIDPDDYRPLKNTPLSKTLAHGN